MSKEQTPITEEEWSIEEHIEALLSLRGFRKDYIVNNRGLIGAIIEDMEQYAKSKVLEALEPQMEFIEELLTIFDGNGVPNIRYVTKLINQYYETAVKPKYE